jgi:hypothetical protein
MSATEEPIFDPASLHKLAGPNQFSNQLGSQSFGAREASTSLPGTKMFAPLVSNILVDDYNDCEDYDDYDYYAD